MRSGLKRFHRPRWLKSDSTKFVVAGLVVVVAGAAIAAIFWSWLGRPHSATTTNSDTLRNLGFLIGGMLAILFGVWRALVAGRQASASQGQTEIGQQSLLNERYQRGAEMLGSEVLAVRLGGVYALQRLAAEHPDDYHLQIMRLLCAFVRTPTKDADLDRPVYFEDEERPPRIRDDAQAALSAIGERSLDRVRLEIEGGFTLDLRGANLVGGFLRECLLDWADLTDANMTNAHLEGASLAGAHLLRANLRGAGMSGANLQRSDLRMANMSEAVAHGTNFTGSNLDGTICYNANVENACLSFSTLKGADLRSVKIAGADVSGTMFGKGGRRTEDDDYGIYARDAYTSLTQMQLDQATAAHDCPPEIEHGTTDAATGNQLVWQR